jgi:general secretion pathway protein A
MYQQFYGLAELPFELTANPRYLFNAPQHREALSTLQYGLASSKTVTLLLGEAGTGKTTLLRTALASEKCRHVTGVYLYNPALTRAEFLELLSTQLALSPRAADSKATFIKELEHLLRWRRERGEVIALVVDEAQALSAEVLEEVRLLANMETETVKLLPLVLAGQPEFAARLNDPALRHLKQRVALRCEITPFSLNETAAYIQSRIVTAGGKPSQLFTREAVTLVHEYSRGIPRTISVICDNALVSGMALARRPVDSELILEVCRDFDISAPPGSRVSRADAPSGGQPAASVYPGAEAQDEISTGAVKPRKFTLLGAHRG